MPFGDRTDQLYDTLYPLVSRTLQKIVRESADFEDMVQTSFELIVRTLRSPRASEIENLPAWSRAIAAHVAVSSLRTRIREREIFDRDVEVATAIAPRLERQLEVRSELAWLQLALSEMRPERAEVILLHDVRGLDISEVAQLMDSSVSAARKRLWRGHRELQEHAARGVRADGR